MRYLIPFLMLASLAPAQVVSVGVKAGVPLSEALPGYNNDYSSGTLDTGRWTVGPTLEVRLLYGFSVEVDALYRGYRAQNNYASSEASILTGTNLISLPAVSYTYRTSTKEWDIPLLLKYRLPAGSRHYRIFLDGGVSFNHSSSDVKLTVICLSGQSLCSASDLDNLYYNPGTFHSSRDTYGPAGGVGLEFKVGKFKLAPEVRFTHLSNPTRNNLEALLGFTF